MQRIDDLCNERRARQCKHFLRLISHSRLGTALFSSSEHFAHLLTGQLPPAPPSHDRLLRPYKLPRPQPLP